MRGSQGLPNRATDSRERNRRYACSGFGWRFFGPGFESGRFHQVQRSEALTSESYITVQPRALTVRSIGDTLPDGFRLERPRPPQSQIVSDTLIGEDV